MTTTQCWRYDALEHGRESGIYSVEDVARRMHAVNQGAATLQTMIFEPSAIRLHLAFGAGPATRLPMRTLNLEELFQ